MLTEAPVACILYVALGPTLLLPGVLSSCADDQNCRVCALRLLLRCCCVLLQLHLDLEKAKINMAGVESRIRDLLREVDTVAAAAHAYATTTTDPHKGLRQVCV